jgi:Pentapeptide repeats (8 copies)
VEQQQAYGEEHEVAENKSSRKILIGVALLVGLVLIVGSSLLITAGVRWYLSPENQLSIVERRDLVQGLASAGQALAVALTGAVGLGGLFFTWRNTNQARESTQRTLELTEQGQITERFTRAIDQLGATDEANNKKLEIRLGGIYALERIANDSPDRDYSTIMEVLTACVRENAPRPLKRISSPGSEPSELKPTASEPTNQEPPTPLADIQAILTVLGRRKKAGQVGDVVLDLSLTDLRGARLEGAHLERAVLQRAHLDRARLERAHLEGANLRGAILEGAHIEGAHLEGTDLRPYLLLSDTDTTLHDVAYITLAEASEGGLTQDQIDQAYGDEHTLLPPDLKPPAHWGVKPNEHNEQG